MRCFHLLVCLAFALTLSVNADAGGSYGSYGSYGSGGSSGGASYGSSGGAQGGYSSGGGLLSRMHARFAARHSGSSGGSYGASSGGSSGGFYTASYASSGSSGGYSQGGLFSRLRAHIDAKRARHAARRSARTGYYANAYSAGGYSSGGASSGGSSGGYYSPAVNFTSLSHGSSGGYASPRIQSNYPIDGYSVDSYPSEYYPSEYYPSDNFVPADQNAYPTEDNSLRGDSSGNGSDPARDANSTNSSDAEKAGDALGDSVIDDSVRYEAQKPTLDDDTALLTVAVPVDSAHVTVNGRDTTSNGTVRQFMSRGLKPGYVYAYEVVVTYNVNGQEQTDVKTIKLRPGDAERLVFQQDAAVGAEEVTPAEETLDTDSTDVEVNAAADGATETVVQLFVPANAVVTLAGNETKGFGRVRTFRTTQLAAGQSWTDYTVSVSATVNGHRIRQERTINVTAGSTVELEFDVAADTLAMR